MSTMARFHRKIFILAASLLILAASGINPWLTEATTTFIGSTIENVDTGQQTITFRTQEGQTWTLGVTDPDLLKNEHLTKGDHISIEVDPKSDKVHKIIKLAEQPRSEPVRTERPSE